MLFVIAAYVIVDQVQRVEIPVQQNLVAKATGQGFADVFMLSVKGGGGFTYRYIFPRTILNIPYTLDFRRLPQNLLIIEWPGPYQNFSYAYPLPAYRYVVDTSVSTCLSDGKLQSDRVGCQNTLVFENREDRAGHTLTIKQEGIRT